MQRSSLTSMMDVREANNIFLKAAMTGTISSPPSTSASAPVKTDKGKGAKKKRLNFSQGEDVLIEVAYGHHKGDYKAMVKFITNHMDILPQNAQNYYRRSSQSAALAKAAEERVRKRVASKLLNASASSSSTRKSAAAQKTRIEDEYESLTDDGEGSDDEGSDDQEGEMDDGYGDEIRKRKRYLLPESSKTRADLNDFMKRAKKDETAQQESGKESQSKSKKKKIEELLASVKEAAESHTQAMKQWEKTLQDDSD